MCIKIKRNIVRAIGMLQSIEKSKWTKDEKSIRTLSALSLAKSYIEEAERLFSENKLKQ